MENIKVFFRKASDYKIITANGAWGGVSPHGEVIMELCVERLDSPEYVELSVSDKGEVKETGRAPVHHIREALVGVVLRADIARSIGQWLIQQADAIASKEGQQGGSGGEYLQ